MILVPKNKGVWQSGSSFVAEDFAYFKGKSAVVIEIEPVDIAWNDIHTRDFEVKSLGLLHLYLGSEQGIFSVPTDQLITSDAKLYEALVSGMNAEFLSHVALLLADRFESSLKNAAFNASERFTLLGLIKSFLNEAESSLFRERVHNLQEHYATRDSLPPLDFEMKLFALRRLLAQNIEAQALILQEMSDALNKIQVFDTELFDIIRLSAKVFTERGLTPFWRSFLKQMGMTPIFPGNPQNEKSLKATMLFSN